jgi:phospholipid/cholesterol/gamma-HCH transport system substrate-binding protein
LYICSKILSKAHQLKPLKSNALKNKKVYIVALAFISALLLFIMGFNFLKGKDIFNREMIFVVEYDEVNGLVKSNPVLIRGLRVGQVRDIYFHPSMNGKLIVTLAVTTKMPIPVNSIARIYSSDLMGSKAIELQLGNSTKFLRQNDTLQSAVEASLMDEVNAQVLPLKNKAETLLSSIDSLVTIVQAILSDNARDNLMGSLQSITSTIKNLENTTGTIDSFVTSQQSRLSSILYNIELITRNIEQNNSEINRSIRNLAVITDSLAKADIPGAVRNADAALSELNQLLASINRGEGTVGQMMQNDTLYQQLEQSAEALRSLLEDIRTNPKKYVKFSVF